MSEMNNVETHKENDGRTRYTVQGTDGWKLITHDADIAKRESMKQERNYGNNRVAY